MTPAHFKSQLLRCGFVCACMVAAAVSAQNAPSAATVAAPDAALNANPVTDSDGKANLKAIATTQARLTALLKLGTPFSLAAQPASPATTYQKDYVWAKAQRWLDVAQDEVRANNRGPFPQAALLQSQALITLLEAAGETDQGLQAGWDTPHLAGANTVRNDIWTPLLLWKQLAVQGAPIAQAGARCALATSGYTEVQLVWAGWVGTHYGWRSALPYISHAERSFDQAQAQFVACRDAAALKAEPAKPVVGAAQAPVVVPAVSPVSVAAPAPAITAPNTAPPAAQATPASDGTLTFPYLSRIVFEHKRSTLSGESLRDVQRLATIWHSYGREHKITLQPSADDTGRGLNNSALLRARAKAVSAALRAQAVPSSFITMVAPAKVAASNAAKNATPDPAKRTVTVIFMKP